MTSFSMTDGDPIHVPMIKQEQIETDEEIGDPTDPTTSSNSPTSSTQTGFDPSRSVQADSQSKSTKSELRFIQSIFIMLYA